MMESEHDLKKVVPNRILWYMLATFLRLLDNLS